MPTLRDFNAIGSTVAMTDSSQTMVNKYAYDPFGKVINQEEAIPQPFKFVGQYGVMTEPNGFYYMRARYYDPSVGRFVSEDPIGFEGGDVNLYAYVGNNPIVYIDPFGEDWVTSVLGTASYLCNTAGLVSKPAKIVGIGVSIVTIGYSAVQYKLGNMSGSEAARNIGIAIGDIASVGGGTLKPLAGHVAGGVTRALGIVNTTHDIVTTATKTPKPTTRRYKP
ncbi:MAG: RHS repeat-associated core domain-containing protein [Thermodesulfobacteriota bacterium]